MPETDTPSPAAPDNGNQTSLKHNSSLKSSLVSPSSQSPNMRLSRNTTSTGPHGVIGNVPTEPRLFVNVSAVSTLKHTSPQSQKYFLDPVLVTENEQDPEVKRSLLQSIFIRACSYGDLEKVQTLLTPPCKAWIDVNVLDDTGSSGLHYACAFGNVRLVDFLLDNGADVEIQDHNGWTPLLWASIRSNLAIVSVLLSHNASKSSRTRAGTTLSAMVSRNCGEDTSPEKCKICEFVCTPADWKRHLQSLPDVSRRFSFSIFSDSEIDESEDDDDNLEGLPPVFTWDKILPHEMIVIAEDKISALFEFAVFQQLYPPVSRRKSWSDLWRKEELDWDPSSAASIIFLTSRYIHYYGAENAVKTVLADAISRLREFMAKYSNMPIPITHALHTIFALLHYLREEQRMFAATLDEQASLTDTASDTLLLLLNAMKAALTPILETAILKYDPMRTESVEVFDKGVRASMKRRVESYWSATSEKSPKELGVLLSEWAHVICLLGIPDSSSRWLWNGVVDWMGAYLFNTILSSNGKYLNRKSGFTIKLNITVLEEWVRSHTRHLFGSHEYSLSGIFDSITSVSTLCGFIQVMVSIRTIEDFLHILHDFQPEDASKAKLTMPQIKQVMTNYKRASDERKVSQEVLEYITMVCEDLEKRHQATCGEPSSAISESSNHPETFNPLTLLLNEDLNHIMKTPKNPTKEEIQTALRHSGRRWRRELSRKKKAWCGDATNPWVSEGLMREIDRKI